jgi:hypothetical protein
LKLLRGGNDASFNSFTPPAPAGLNLNLFTGAIYSDRDAVSQITQDFIWHDIDFR